MNVGKSSKADKGGHMVIGDCRVKLSRGDVVEIKKKTIGQLEKENIWLAGDGGIVEKLWWGCGSGNKMCW